jgi:hypothetical protein
MVTRIAFVLALFSMGAQAEFAPIHNGVIGIPVAAANPGGKINQLDPNNANKFTSAIGKMGGCTVTVVSPPQSPVTAVLKSAHCQRGTAVQFPGEEVGGFTCFANRFFQARGGSAGDDLNLCFSTQKPQTQTYGCMTQTPPAQINAPLRFFGFGNPVFGRPQNRELLTGVTRLVRTQLNGAMIAAGPAYVTPGDSGGPVIDRVDGGNTFNVAGVTSKYIRFGNTPPMSAFAPTGTPQSQSFFRRAVDAAGRMLGFTGAQAPLVCGVNYAAVNNPAPNFGNTLPMAGQPVPLAARLPSSLRNVTAGLASVTH